MRIRRYVVIALVACAFVVPFVIASAFTSHGATYARWTHYLDRRTGNVVVVKTRCILAEDSAYELRTRDWRDGGGHVVIGCRRRGY